jgi:tetratricopeptide (TPR) repeat protein
MEPGEYDEEAEGVLYLKHLLQCCDDANDANADELARTYATQALEWARSLPRAPACDLFRALAVSGVTGTSAEDYEPAILHLQEAAGMPPDVWSSDMRHGILHGGLGCALRGAGRYRDASAAYATALSAALAQSVPEHTTVLVALEGLATCAFARGEFITAAARCVSCLVGYRALIEARGLPDDDPIIGNVVRVSVQYTSALLELGEYSTARYNGTMTLDLQEERGLPERDWAQIAQIDRLIGRAYTGLYLFVAAEQTFERASRALAEDDPRHPYIGLIRVSQAERECAQKKWGSAISMLDAQEALVPLRGLENVRRNILYAEALIGQGNWTLAIERLRWLRAFLDADKCYAEVHEVAVVDLRLGDAIVGLGADTSDAIIHYRRAFVVFLARVGPTHARTIEACEKLAILQEALGQPEAAAETRSAVQSHPSAGQLAMVDFIDGLVSVFEQEA